MLTDLPEQEIQLTTLDRKIIQARSEGISFSELSFDECKTSMDKILFSGAAITGAAVPQTEFFADYLSREIYIHITEFGRGELTFSEVILALRINARGELRLPSGSPLEHIEFRGNCFNVDFLSKILYNYMRFRDSLDRKLENYLDGYITL